MIMTREITMMSRSRMKAEPALRTQVSFLSFDLFSVDSSARVLIPTSLSSFFCASDWNTHFSCLEWCWGSKRNWFFTLFDTLHCPKYTDNKYLLHKRIIFNHDKVNALLYNALYSKDDENRKKPLQAASVHSTRVQMKISKQPVWCQHHQHHQH